MDSSRASKALELKTRWVVLDVGEEHDLKNLTQDPETKLACHLFTDLIMDK